MKLENILRHIEKLLVEENMEASVMEGNDEQPQDRLLVFIGNDVNSREQILEITAQDQEIGESLKQEIPVDAAHLARVQFQVKLPFKVANKASKEVAGLLCYLNRQMELPGWELSEVDDRIFYRHVLLTTHEEINKPLLVAITGMIMFILRIYSELVEGVAIGNMTFNNVLEKIIEASQD